MDNEQKNKSNVNTGKTATRSKKNKKYTNKPLVVLVIVCIVAVGVMYWLKSSRAKEVEKTSSSGVSDSTVTQEEAVDSQREEGVLIDMENTTNARIENGEKINTSSELYTEKTFQGMNIKDIKLQTKDYISNFTATVINNSGADYAGGKITIVFTNQDGSEYSRLESLLPAIKNGETNEITASTTADIINAYNFSIE